MHHLKDSHCRRLKGHPLQVKHQQRWKRGFILLLKLDAVHPG